MSAMLAPASGGGRSAVDRSQGTSPVVWIVVDLVLIAALFGDRFVRLVSVWWNDANYSHGFLVPFLAAWLAWRNDRPRGEGETGPGLAALVAGCLLHLLALLFDGPLIDFFALALVLRGLAILAGGRVWASGFTFPILFLFFLFPLPRVWTDAAALGLQDIVSRASALVLDQFTICYRQGNALHLAGLPAPLVVAAECSGLRQIVAFLALAALVGALGRQPGWVRVVLLLAALPVALVANIFRVLLMAAGATWFGTGWLTGSLHDAPALLTLPVGLLLFAFIAWLFMQPEAEGPNKEAMPCPPAA